mgnify:CR=1 FL=1
MRTRIVAEVASNHAGSLPLAKEFIRIAAAVGADCVKFQSSRYEDLSRREDPQADWVRMTSLSDDAHRELIDTCRAHKIGFLTTCFSRTRVPFLTSLGMDEIKVASPDLMSFPLIELLSASFRHIIISTGLHTCAEIRQATAFLTRKRINATLLHSVSIYPTPPEKAFMGKFLWLRTIYPHVGYSNHVPGTEAAKFAIAQGAEIVEVHFKLGKFGPGRATEWDLTPEELHDLIEYRNLIEKLTGKQEWLEDASFLFPEELAGRDRFIGRWVDNRKP